MSREPIERPNWQHEVEQLGNFHFVDCQHMLGHMHPNWPMFENSLKDLILTIEKYLPETADMARTMAVLNMMTSHFLMVCGAQDAAAAVEKLPA